MSQNDDELIAAVGRLEAAMVAAASNVDDLINAAAEARAEIVHEEFGAGEKP